MSPLTYLMYLGGELRVVLFSTPETKSTRELLSNQLSIVKT